VYSPSERALIRSAAEASMLVDQAEVELALTVRTNRGSRTALAAAASEIIRASRNTSRIASTLLGGPQLGDETKPRIEQLAIAWDQMNRAVQDSLPAAITKVTNLVPSAVFPLRDALDRLRAISQLSPDSLVHADPADPQSTGPIRTVLGPHGNYYNFQQHTYGAIHYWRDFADDWVKVYLQQKGKDAAFGDAFGIYATCVSTLLRAAALIANISLYWKWDNYDQFHRVIQAGDLLWLAAEGEGAGQLYYGVMEAWSKVATTSAAYKHSILRLSDSWRHMDRAGRELLNVFPNRPDLSV
jgi:hypothetical protein